MTLCKVFYLETEDFEEKVNDWLRENSGISIAKTCISEKKSILVIFYLA
jgi:hypothetical protein